MDESLTQEAAGPLKHVYAINRKLACKPPPPQTVTTKISGGFATIQNRQTLIPLEVVFGDNERIHPGDIAYIPGDAFKLAWSQAIFTVDGVNIVLVPLDAVQLIAKPDLKLWKTQSGPIATLCGSNSGATAGNDS